MIPTTPKTKVLRCKLMRTPRKNARVPFRKEERRAFIMKLLTKFGRKNMATTTKLDLRSLNDSET